MSKKFTEEQYQRIIKAWQSENTFIHQTEAVIDCLIDDLNLSVTLIGEEAFALSNPLTRKWAHEQFVEKEKKYVWRLKTDKNLVISTLFDGWFVDGAPAGKMRFSEEEIGNSPFKPEWFYKEEV